MKPLSFEFVPNSSFCYRFARYHLLPEIAAEPEVASGEPFKLSPIVNRLIARYLTDEQLSITFPAREAADKMRQVGSAIRFYASFRAKRGSESPFVWVGEGMYRLKSETEVDMEQVEDQDEAVEEQVDIEYEGWIYAFSFPAIRKEREPFPIKVGLTTAADVETRVYGQCRGSGFFERPVILGRWQVNRVQQVESAVHAVLTAKGKKKEDAPGDEWFVTTMDEVESIVKFVTA